MKYKYINFIVTLVFLLGFASSSFGQDRRFTINGAAEKCPSSEISYSYTFNPLIGEEGCTYSSRKWNVTGGTIVGNDNGGTVLVRWGSGATGTVSVTFTGKSDICIKNGDYASLTVTSKIPTTAPAAPTGITIDNPVSSFCPSDVISLEATVDPDLNADGDSKNNVDYIWERKIGEGSWGGRRRTSSKTLNWTVPNLNINTDDSEDIVFRVKTVYRNCSSGAVESAFSGESATSFINIRPPLPDYDIINKSCNSESGIRINSIGGAGDLQTEFRIQDFPGSMPTFKRSDLPLRLNIDPGSYVLKLQYKNNPICTRILDFNIEDETVDLTVSFSNISNVSCFGGSDGAATINVTGGSGSYTYKLNGSAVTSNISGLAAGSYTVDVNEGINCVGQETFTISQPDAALEITNAYASRDDLNGFDISCKGGSNGQIAVEAIGGTPPYRYSINGITYTGNLTGLSAGTYNVYVKDDKGCVATYSETVTLVEPDQITASITKTNPICAFDNSGAITVSNATGGTGTYMYSLNDVDYLTTNTFTGRSAGSYTVWIKDQNGCKKSYAVTLEDPEEITFGVSTINQSCPSNLDGSITIENVTYGTAPYQYSIDGAFFKSDNTYDFLETGTYPVTVRDDNQCTKTINVFVAINDPLELTPVFSSYNGYEISCSGAEDGSIEVNVAGGTGADYTYSWSGFPDNTSNRLEGLEAGTYTVEVTDGRACSIIKSYTLTEPSPLRADALISDYDGFNISCFGFNDGAIQVEATGGTTPYSYLWSTGETTPNITDLTAGDYSVEITDFNGCSITENYSLTEPDQLNFLEPQITDVECFGDASGQVILYTSGGVSDKQFSMDGINFQSENVFNNLMAGDYTFYVRDANNCADQIELNISQPSRLNVSIVNAGNARCGDAVGFAKASIEGGIEPYNVQWVNNAGEVVEQGLELNNVLADIYRVIVNDANNCVDESIVYITSTDGPQVSVDYIYPTSCFDSADGRASISISGDGPFDVSWANGEIGKSATELVSGINAAKITDVNGCVVVKQIDVPSPEPIVISIVESILPTCYNGADGSIEVDITGGTGDYDISWSNGSSTKSISNIASGTYNITVSDENGCSLTKSIFIGEKEPLDLEIIEVINPSCVGSSNGSIEVKAIGGNKGYTYKWNNGKIGAKLTEVSAGNYSVTVIDSEGCTFEEPITIVDPEPFQIQVDTELEICTGSSFITDYNIPGAVKYFWSSENGFESDQRIVELSTEGTYQLTVENENGCIATENFELIVSDDLLSADMTMASEAIIGDTIVVIDISWPIPDEVSWEIPEGVTVLEENNDYVSLIFNQEGSFELGLEVKQAECLDYYSQIINISSKSQEENSNQRNFGISEKLIKKFNVYPNPIVNNFNIDIELSQKHDLSVNIIDLKGNRIIFNESFKDKIEYLIPMKDILNSGVYIVRINVGGESSYKRIIVR
ncbi:T9SS type A sorting domain-containing protein [Marivirga arenosa]|uniref:T9SS type A sorting domain-containing protein n=1 Tax=Marivirga arenosa TaxID=3059076 RepID=A0AA51ZUU9_9BACT|nr:T9SS type A sorting domain-containing protein [Marivirga sp. BKB1-2]WNB17084.1 T9SS type A sorting domain-containing protein [Marivirga sp. BKB1-2]